MNIMISQEALEKAMELAISSLEDIVKKVSSGDKTFEQLSEHAKDLVRASLIDVRNNDLSRAVEKLQEVIRTEPEYSRGRLQLMNIHKKMKYDYTVAFSGDIVYERAKDRYTKMQAASIVGEVYHAVDRRW
jgi:hypothetical protein